MVRIGAYFLTVFLCFFCFAGCEPSHQLKEKKETSYKRELDKNKQTASFFEQNSKLPLKLNEEQFHSVSEWKNNHTIFYIMNEGSSSIIYTYDLLNNETDKFYESEAPIVDIEVNHNRTLFLIHTSLSNDEADMIILDKNGNVKFEKRIKSYDLQYAWNKSNDDQLFIAAFNEDWTFQTYLFYINEEKSIENPLQVPFVQWLNDNQLTYIKWNENELALSAPLYIYDLKKKEETLFLEKVIANSTFNKMMLSVQLTDHNGKGSYIFHDMKTKEKIMSFDTQLVSQYSEWLVPYFAFNEKEKVFYTFVNKGRENAFRLSKFDLVTGDQEVIIDHIENFPIKLSPNGRYLLYGPRYEKIIDLKLGKIEDLVLLNNE